MATQLSADRRTAQHRDNTDPPRFARASLLVIEALVAITAIAGGVALILGALNAELATVLSPPIAYLEGSPFSSYLVPGLVLAIVVGGTQTVAFLLGVTRSDLGLLGAATAAIALLIWVFVQMMFIPFSFLQAMYFAFGIAETCLVLIALGILHVRSTFR
jgi:hypothetical protein